MSQKESSNVFDIEEIDIRNAIDKVKNNHKAGFNFFAGLLTAILLMMIGGVIREYAGYPSYSLLESTVIALLLGVSLGKDIGGAIQNGDRMAYYFLGLAGGLSLVLTYWVWGTTSLVAAILIVTTTIVSILSYTEDEEFEFKATIHSIPGMKFVSNRSNVNLEFTTFASIIIGFILLKGFISLEEVSALISYFADTVSS